MGINCSINVKVASDYGKDVIEYILKKGEEKNFVYARQTMMPLLNCAQAADMVMQEYMNDEGGPAVFFSEKENPDMNGFLWFFKTEDNLLKCSMGGFGVLKRKNYRYFSSTLEDSLYHIDMDYYIRLLLDLVKDLFILQIEINEI
jgi:hypothetical protein